VQKITTFLQAPSTPKSPAKDLPLTATAPESSPTADKETSSMDKRGKRPSRSALLATLDHAALTVASVDMYAAAEALEILAEDGIVDWTATDRRRLAVAISDLRKACVTCWNASKEKSGKDSEESRETVRRVVDMMVRCAEVSNSNFDLCFVDFRHTMIKLT
jgi:hypothetical protein